MKVSNCCSAPVSYVEEDDDNHLAVCNECKEHCEWEEVEEIPLFKGTMEALNNLTILSPNQTLSMLGSEEEFNK